MPYVSNQFMTTKVFFIVNLWYTYAHLRPNNWSKWTLPQLKKDHIWQTIVSSQGEGQFYANSFHGVSLIQVNIIFVILERTFNSGYSIIQLTLFCQIIIFQFLHYIFRCFLLDVSMLFIAHIDQIIVLLGCFE